MATTTQTTITIHGSISKKARLIFTIAAITQAIRLDPYDADLFAQAAQIKLATRDWAASLELAEQGLARCVVTDVYQGMEGVERGTVKYLRVCEEVRANLIQLEDGSYQADHEPFQDWYATPIHKVPGIADKPIIKATNTDEESKISWIVVKSDIPVNEVRIITEDVMKPRFERTEGVA